MRTGSHGGENLNIIFQHRDHDDAQLWMISEDAASRRDAIDTRHVDLHEHNVRLGAVHLRDGGCSKALPLRPQYLAVRRRGRLALPEIEQSHLQLEVELYP